MDPLAKVIRKKLRKMNIHKLKVVYSEEEPLRPIDDPNISCRFHCICPNKDMRKCTDRRDIPASNAFVPAAAGLICGGEVIKDLVRIAGTWRLTSEMIAENPETKAAAEKAAAKAEAHQEKYKAIALAKKNGTWEDDTVRMALPFD